MWLRARPKCILLPGLLLLAPWLIEGFWPTTYMGEDCMTPCMTRGYDYFWCHTKSGWSFCSPFNNVSSSGKMCRKFHPCRQITREAEYLQCELEDGGLDHCGVNNYVGPHSISTTFEAFCTNECEQRGYNYYWCATYKGWDYCSPTRDTTYRGAPCRTDHFCHRHGHKYTWCYSGTSWDYCGNVVDCSYWPAEDPLVNATDCIVQQGDRQIRFQYEPDVTIDQVRNHYLHQEALRLIDDWQYGRIDRGLKAGTLIKHRLVRIDQGYANGRDEAILLLQIIEEPDLPGTGTTMAKVLIPTDTTLNYEFVRRAMVNSLNRRERVTLNVTSTP